MRRCDVIGAVARAVDAETPIVCNIGQPCKELYAAADRELNFYMLGSLGMASSIGLGLALAGAERGDGRVVVIDGDGGALMNLGSLATIGRYRPAGFVLVIVDNGVHGSTGGQETATSHGCDLAGVARECGVPDVLTADDLDEFAHGFCEALVAGRTTVVVARVRPGAPEAEEVPLGGPEIRDRFMRGLG